MPSIRQFHTAVDIISPSAAFVYLQLPLQASSGGIGWRTELKFLHNPTQRVDTVASLGVINRWTGFVKPTTRGLQRVVSYSPSTEDRIEFTTSLVRVSTIRRYWQREYSALRLLGPRQGQWHVNGPKPTDVIGPRSFNPADLITLIRGVIKNGQGEPLVDWLLDNAEEYVPYLTQPGLLANGGI